MLYIREMSININAKFDELTRNKRKILAKLTLMFKLTDIQIIIFRKIINNNFDDFHKKSLKSIKFIIKKL